MFHRTWPLLLVVAALMLFVGQPAFAADSHEGKVVKAGEGKLTMTDKDGKNRHTHDVPIDAKITCDGKACLLADIKEGFTVTVTTDNAKKVTKIEAKSGK